VEIEVLSMPHAGFGGIRQFIEALFSKYKWCGMGLGRHI
jgi:hypothetical protein